MISHDINGDAQRYPQDELCNTIRSHDEADHCPCHRERKKVGRQERDVDVLGEPEESRNSAQERLSGESLGLLVMMAFFQQNMSGCHILPPRSCVRAGMRSEWAY